MPHPILIGLIIAVAFVVIATLKLLAAVRGRRGFYVLRPALFTPAERAFLAVLERILPPGVRVFGKVRLADVFAEQRDLNARERRSARNRIDRKHVDFLLVRSADLAPLAGIELDDRSHEEPDRQARDAFVNETFDRAGLPLLHVSVQKTYDPAELKTKIVDLLAGNSDRA